MALRRVKVRVPAQTCCVAQRGFRLGCFYRSRSSCMLFCTPSALCLSTSPRPIAIPIAGVLCFLIGFQGNPTKKCLVSFYFCLSAVYRCCLRLSVCVAVCLTFCLPGGLSVCLVCTFSMRFSVLPVLSVLSCSLLCLWLR